MLKPPASNQWTVVTQDSGLVLKRHEGAIQRWRVSVAKCCVSHVEQTEFFPATSLKGAGEKTPSGSRL